MDKIGILSFVEANNYGGILQIYALQTVLERKSKVQIINYKSDFIKSCYKLPTIKKFFNIRFIYNALFRNSITFYYSKGFDKFRNDFLKISSKEYNKLNFDEVKEDYNKVIVGSDQVWSMNCNGNDVNYFLPFKSSKCKKYSYAASFGSSELNEQLNDIICKYINDYEKISVREISGIEIIKSSINKDVKVTCDPTLLLNKNEWVKIMDDRIIEDNYLLVYMIIEDKKIIKLARKIAKEKKLKIIYINNRLFKKIGMNNYSKVSPNMWLNLFYYSSYIITNSFHGIAFSINFNKDFQCNLLPRNNKSNIRILSILNEYDLSDRINDKSYKNNIDYKKVNDKLDENRKKSIKFINEIINK